MNATHKKVQIVALRKNKNSYNLLLLQTKSDRGEYWQNITGSLEGDESFEEGALRELKEETGLSGSLHKLSLEYEFHDRWNRDVEEKVYFSLVEDGDVVLCEQEHQNYKWLAIDEVTRDDFGHTSNYEAFFEAVKCLS